MTSYWLFTNYFTTLNFIPHAFPYFKDNCLHIPRNSDPRDIFWIKHLLSTFRWCCFVHNLAPHLRIPRSCILVICSNRHLCINSHLAWFSYVALILSLSKTVPKTRWIRFSLSYSLFSIVSICSIVADSTVAVRSREIFTHSSPVAFLKIFNFPLYLFLSRFHYLSNFYRWNYQLSLQ